MYTGRVSVGGPADVHELGHLIISKLAVGPYDNNVYLLRCRETGAQVLVDAAADPDRIMDLIGPDGISMVLTTHRHPDHWQALAEIVARTGALTAAHALDAPGIPVPTDILLTDGDLVPVGTCQLEVIHLVGHTPGSAALKYDDPEGPPHVITGDCLFPGGVGKTTTPEDFESLYAGVVERLFDPLPDETWIYPGHGYDTTVGAERPALAEWRERGW
ncbi:MAG: MBL fold metallo-hydrolase [Actinomycetales bacterium]|nr:MBL fold metallo-hydrolase [Actinomycetales bacterium]